MPNAWIFHKHELILDRFRLLELLGCGSHGAVFKAFDEEDKREVAIKVDENEKRNITECTVYHGLRRIPGIPIYFGCGYASNHSCLIMQLLDKSVDMYMLEHPLKLAEVSRLGKLLLRTLQQCHQRRVVHRDIKPQNIMLGTDQGSLIPYLVDWGLASTFWDSAQKRHRNPAWASRIVGTDYFMSIRVQEGHRYSRRDDIESLGYTLLWMSQCSLPWSRSPGSKHPSNRSIGRAKRELISKSHPDCPVALHRFLSYSHTLRYQDDPNYEHLDGILDDLSQEYQEFI